jgi:hypothetical protein
VKKDGEVVAKAHGFYRDTTFSELRKLGCVDSCFMLHDKCCPVRHPSPRA